MPLWIDRNRCGPALSSEYERVQRGYLGKSQSKIQTCNMIQKPLTRVRIQPYVPSRPPIRPGCPPTAPAATRMALPVPVWDCSGRSCHGTPPSFPNRSDDADRGVFQAAPNYAAGCHFRPLIHFDARSPSGRSVGDGWRTGRAAPVMTHHCAVGSDPAAAPRTRAGTAGTSRTDSTSAVERVGERPSLFAFWAESFDTRTGGARLGVANMAIRVDSFPTALGDLGWLGMLVEPSGGNKSSGRTIAAPIAARFARAAEDADQAAVSSTAQSAGGVSASPRCSTGEAYWRIGERMWVALLATLVDAFALDH